MNAMKALADETRMKIVLLLLKRNFCVRALSKKLEISEAAVSQQLKILKEANIITGEKQSYFMHYQVNKTALQKLSEEIKGLTEIEREICDGNISENSCCCKSNHNCKCKLKEDINSGKK